MLTRLSIALYGLWLKLSGGAAGLWRRTGVKVTSSLGRVLLMVLMLVLLEWACEDRPLQRELERLKSELAAERLRASALADSMRVLYADSLASIAAREVLPGAEALAAATSREVERLLRRHKAELEQLITFTYEERPIVVAGEAVELPGTDLPGADLPGADQGRLRFATSDTTTGYLVLSDLLIDVVSRRLSYRTTVVPDERRFEVYLTEKEGGVREVWVRGPGLFKHLYSYALPADYAPPKAARRLHGRAAIEAVLTPRTFATFAGAGAAYRAGPAEVELLLGHLSGTGAAARAGLRLTF